MSSRRTGRLFRRDAARTGAPTVRWGVVAVLFRHRFRDTLERVYR